MKKTTIISGAAACMLAMTGAANAGFVDVILDRDAQNGGSNGNLGTIFQPVDVNGDPAPLWITARSHVDRDAPFDFNASGETGTIWVDDQGFGVKNLGGGGSGGISGLGGHQNEELIFTFGGFALSGSLQLGFTGFDLGDGLGDRDDPVIFVVLDDASWITLDEVDFADAFTFDESDSGGSGILDFGAIDVLNPSLSVAALVVRETHGHVQVNSIAYSTIPSPGALALIGLAGIVGRRRRGR